MRRHTANCHRHNVFQAWNPGVLRPRPGTWRTGGRRDEGYKKKPPRNHNRGGQGRRLPTLPPFGSTIGASGLNFSVRDGKRWDPAAIATFVLPPGDGPPYPRRMSCERLKRKNRKTAKEHARAISTARLGRRRPYTCRLSTW